MFCLELDISLLDIDMNFLDNLMKNGKAEVNIVVTLLEIAKGDSMKQFKPIETKLWCKTMNLIY